MLPLLRIALVLLPTSVMAQTLVGTSLLSRTALLEEFTAVHCGNCPASHTVADALATTYAYDLTIIAVHGGPLASPGAGQPDLRSNAGTALWSLFGVAFQPQGNISREGLTEVSDWSASVASVLAMPSPANIGVASHHDPNTSVLTVDVEVYYTGDGPVGEDRIHVALTEDHIVAYQQDYVNGPHTTYDHRHVLRDFLTPLSGEPVTVTTPGTLVERSYSFTVPAGWDISELDVVAFVAEADGEVHQVRSVDADGGMTLSTGALPEEHFGPGPAYPVPASDHLYLPLASGEAGQPLLLTDAWGRFLQPPRYTTSGSVLRLDVTDLAPGIYSIGFPGGRSRRIVVGH
ncbi:MAG TPA: Omp28-related outer membrane protein [Flavobacteriales bacterium]